MNEQQETGNNSSWVQYEKPQDLAWDEYRKVVPISAARVKGKFIVNTSEGVLTCEDGYICIDSRGYFYPVAKDEFEAIYVLYEREL